ncbi:MAG: hypothetical protein IJ429_02295 [Lachnospiraceae bacterium]|nr:hypothetical protein [Lachnospiraceae bacterium]
MKSVTNTVKKLNKTAVIVAVVHFFVSFLTDRLIFDYVLLDFSTTKQMLRTIETAGVKLAFLLFVILLWQGVFWAAKHADRTFLKVAGGYMLLMTVLLLLTWPGIWRMDEFGILSSSVQLYPHFWQNYITTVFYVLALMLLPFPAGVIIVQCVCVSLVVARLVTLGLNDSLKTERKLQSAVKRAVLILPFLMLPVLDSNLYPIRMSLYAFLEVLLIAELFFLAKKQGNSEVAEKDCRYYWCYITLLAAVVTLWRTEAVYYFVAYPVLLLLVGRGRKYVKYMILYFIIAVILFVPQKIGERLTSGQQYELTSIVLPLVPLVEAADENADPQDQKLLAVMDQVVNVEVTLEGAAEGKSGINLFWGEPGFQREYTPEQFAEFKSAFYQLALKYPGVFLKERWETFTESSDLLENTTDLFTRDGVPNYETFKNYPISNPINNEIRTDVIKRLELRDVHDYNVKLAMTDYVYSAIPAIIVLAVTAVCLLLRRRWITLVLVLTVLVKVPLIFLTAPSRLFMYYYSVYLFGYCVLFYIIYQLCIRFRGEEPVV